MLLPDWMPAEAWEGYIAMRKKIKKPASDRAIQLAIALLDSMRLQGADVGAVLDQSTLNGWQGIFPLREQQQVQRVASPKFKTLGKHGQATANNLMDWLEEA